MVDRVLTPDESLPASGLSGRDVAGLTVLTLIGLLLRLAAVAALVGFSAPPKPGTDSEEYDTYAWNVAQGRGYRGMTSDVTDQDHFTAYRPPTQPLFYAAIYRAFGHSYPAAHVADSIVSALTILLVFAIGNQCFGRTAAWLSAITYTFYPMALYFNAELLSETTATFLLCSLAYALLRLKDSIGWKWSIVAGISLGVFLLCKPGFVYLVPALVVLAPLVFRWERGPWIRLFAAFVIGGLIMVPWAVRNTLVLGRFIPLSTLGGQALLISYNRIVIEDPALYGYCIMDNSIPEYTEGLKAPNDEYLRDQVAKQYAMEWIHANPDKLFYLVKWRFVRYWLPWGTGGSLVQRLAIYTPYAVVLLCFILVTPGQVRRFLRDRSPTIFLYAFILTNLAVALSFFGLHRYRFPTDCLLIILGAGGLVHFFQSRKNVQAPTSSMGRFPRFAMTAGIALAVIGLGAAWRSDERKIEAFRTETCLARIKAVADAVARFQADQGKAPASLKDLVPRYLPNIQALHCPKHSLGWDDYEMLKKADPKGCDEAISYRLSDDGSTVTEIVDRHAGAVSAVPIPKATTTPTTGGASPSAKP